MILTDDILSALVAVARDAYLSERAAGVPAIDPLPGDLVVVTEGCPRAGGNLDPDAIGWLVAGGARRRTATCRWLRRGARGLGCSVAERSACSHGPAWSVCRWEAVSALEERDLCSRPGSCRCTGRSDDEGAMMTVEQISAVQRIGRDETNQRTSLGLTELDELCATARAGVRLADMLRGFVGPGAMSVVGPRTIESLQQLLRAAGFEP